MHPGDKPFDNLAKALNKSYDGNTQIGCIKAELKRGPKGLIEAIKSERITKKEIILLVVDQFEELFRYKQNNNIDEVIAFIALLIESANQQEMPIHIVITRTAAGEDHFLAVRRPDREVVISLHSG